MNIRHLLLLTSLSSWIMNASFEKDIELFNEKMTKQVAALSANMDTTVKNLEKTFEKTGKSVSNRIITQAVGAGILLISINSLLIPSLKEIYSEKNKSKEQKSHLFKQFLAGLAGVAGGLIAMNYHNYYAN